MSSCCCIEFLKRPWSQTPLMRHDNSGRGETTFEDLLRLQRRNQGTWHPTSPKVTCASPLWASPTPARDTFGSDNLDFDFVMEELTNTVKARDADNTTLIDFDQTKNLGSSHIPAKSGFVVEQLLCSPGTLPQGLPLDRREALIRSTGPTATSQMLSVVPEGLLQQSSEQAQQLRRKIADGATVVFINAGLPGKRFTFQRAAALGIKCVILESSDSWAKSLVGEGVIAKFIPIDMSQSSEDIFNAALAAIKSLGKDGLTGPADGIATFVELAVPLVARLTEALALPGHRPIAVDNARDKYKSRACLKAAGLPTPRNALITTEEDVVRAGEEVGFPAVIKPSSGAASLGVKKVMSMQDLLDSFKEITRELSSLVVSSGALIKCEPGSNDGVNACNMIKLNLILEQFLDGNEVDVDVVMSGGEWVYAGLADNGPTYEPYFNETWAVCPSLLPKQQQKELKELAVNSVKAMGFSSGVFHVECKATSHGPHLIEVNARMGGGQVHECNLRTWGVDLVEETLFAALGIPARPLVPKEPLTASAYCYVNSKESGRVVDIRGLEGLMKKEGVIWAKPLVDKGAIVVGPNEGLPTWLCDLFVTRKTAKEALAYLMELETEVPIIIEPVQ